MKAVNAIKRKNFPLFHDDGTISRNCLLPLRVRGSWRGNESRRGSLMQFEGLSRLGKPYERKLLCRLFDLLDFVCDELSE
jgi:hypothetical protein